MNVLIKHMAMPKGCIYANDKDQTDYCPMLNHDDVPFCQYIENEPESAIGIDERPVYCPLSDVPDTNVGDIISRQAAIDFIDAGHLCNPNEPRWSDNEVVNFLKSRPPAQPEKTQLSGESTTKDSTFDCISRQAVLDAVRNIRAIKGTADDEILLIDKAEVQTELMRLPSAQPQLDTCPIYGGMCGYPSNLCYECPRHEGAKERPQWWTEGLQPFAQPERMKGEWIDVTKTGGAELWKCSECGELELEDSYFCPNCGSDNRGEDDE